MDALFGASIIASFLAGMVALFAPCCITVLLPAYIASAFRGKKKMLKMTFIFFAGLSTVLVPIGLGAAGLAQVFQNFHRELWLFGGAFMLVLAVLSVYGKGLALPMPARAKEMLRAGAGEHGKSVYTLGVLSGAATSCCAP
ncbi:MAG: cytochrome c biogenesis protein CcdA, partial [bacterium]|nr:cytochrome c biogenesis protein CcdA [bacterium]